MKTSLVIVAGLALILVGCNKTASPRAAVNADMYTNSYDAELDMQIGIAVHAYNMGGDMMRVKDLEEQAGGTISLPKEADIPMATIYDLTNFLATNFWAEKAINEGRAGK